MNKLISKIVGVALGLALATGVGAGVVLGNKNISKAEAAEVKVAEATFDAADSSDAVSGYTTTWTTTHNSFDWEVANFNRNSSNGTWDGYVKCGRKKNASVAYVATVAAVSSKVSRATITIDALTASKINSITLFSGNAKAAQTTSLGTFSKATGTQTVNVAAADQAAGKYYTIVFNCASGSSNGLLTLSNVTFYAESSDVYPTSISCAAQSINVLQKVTLPEVVTFTNSGGQTVTVKNLTYSLSSGSDYIDLDTSTGVVTGKKAGTAVVAITAETNNSGGTTSCNATINVSSIAAPGISAGENYVLYAVAEGKGNFELTGVASNIGSATQFSGDVPSCSYVLTVENGYYENTVAFKNGSAYLALTSSGNNLHTNSEVNANSSWLVTYDSSDNSATITNTAFADRSIKYNADSPRFACYTGGQTNVLLYPYSDKALTDFTIDASISVYKTGTATIGVTYTPADASDKTLTWATSDATVATVVDGVVTGVEVGTCTVTASKVIGGVTVERTCAVTVLNNKAAHLGTSADPFDINDAVNVANGVFTQTSNGTAVDLANTYYYVKGILTKYVNRTTSTLTFWLGDDASQQSAATGGFEIFKAAKVYGANLADAYTADSEVQRDFNVGYTIKASGKLLNYNGTPEMNAGGYIYYNSYIEVRKYAEAFNTALEAVCDANGNTVAADLESAWSAQATAYAALDATLEQPILKNATAKTTSNATAVELCAAKYDYILGKYGTSTLSNFINRTVAPSSANARFAAIESNNAALVVVAITAFVGITFVGGYFLLRKKKEN